MESKISNKKVKDTRMMPHSIESEQCVLGCALIDSDASFGIMSDLKVNDFYSETHKLIFESMYKLFSNNTPIDIITLTENLEKNGYITNKMTLNKPDKTLIFCATVISAICAVIWDAMNFFIPCIVIAAIYLLIAAVAVFTRSKVEKVENAEKKYDRQFL